MSETTAIILPYLFTVLISYMIINLLMNGLLYTAMKKSLYLKQANFWLINVIAIITAGLFKDNNIQMCISQMIYIFVTYMIYKIVSIEFKDTASSFKNLFYLHFSMTALSFVLESIYGNFLITSLPIEFSLSLSFIFIAYSVLIKHKKSTSIYTKSIGILSLFMPIHCLNFSLFRLDPANQIWGWSVNMGYATVMSFLFSALSSYLAAKREKELLEQKVEERTIELNEQNLILEDYAADKSALFRVVVHDVSNPLVVAIGTMKRLIKEPTKLLEFSKTIMNSLNLIVEIIEQTRKLEQAESGKLYIEKESILVTDIVNSIKPQSIHKCKEKDIIFEVFDLTKPGTTVLIEKIIFCNTIIANLVSNAYKFSHKNSLITLTIDQEDHNISFEISDQGVGIEPERIDNLFRIDVPTSTRGTHKEPGTGFGLPLVKKYIELMAGSINVTSDEMGTSFKVLIPIGQSSYHNNIILSEENSELKATIEKGIL